MLPSSLWTSPWGVFAGGDPQIDLHPQGLESREQWRQAEMVDLFATLIREQERDALTRLKESL